MAVHGGPNIVNDGLVFLVDAADKNSYPGSGTAWTDISGKGAVSYTHLTMPTNREV